MPVDPRKLLAVAMAAMSEPRREPSDEELRGLAERCRRADLATLGHLLFESRDDRSSEVILAELKTRGIG